MNELLAMLGLKWVTLVPSFFGSLVSLKFIDALNVWQRISTVFAGALAAAYCSPLTVDLLSLSPKLEAAVAFLGGLFGMSIAGAAIKAIPEWLAAAKSKYLGGGQ